MIFDYVDPVHSYSFPHFTPIVMYIKISSESTCKTMIVALSLKPEFDAWLNQKKLQAQMESQASSLKMTQTSQTLLFLGLKLTRSQIL